MRKRILVTVFSLQLWLVGSGHAQQWAVSLIEILASPKDALVAYPEGIGTIGFLHFDGAGAAWLFLTRDHAIANDTPSALFLSGRPDSGLYEMKCDNVYVLVTGMIVVDGGHLSIGEIESVRRTDDNSYCFMRDTD